MDRLLASLTPGLCSPERAVAQPQPGSSLLDLPSRVLVSQGRAAIALALRHAQLPPGSNVLLPAFHCPAMTAGIEAAGFRWRCFGVRDDLSVDPDAVLLAGSPDTAAVLVPHFFAWRQPKQLFDRIRGSTSWVIIEDCAHSFFGSAESDPMGSWGDYAVGSVSKFFPTNWGGVLGSSSRMLDIKLDAVGTVFQAKLAANVVESAAAYGNLGPFSAPVRSALGAVSTLRRSMGSASQVVGDGTGDPSVAMPSYGCVDFQRLDQEAGWWVRRAIRNADRCLQRAAARVAVFDELDRALGVLTQARLPARERVPDFPPYVYPILLSEPSEQFRRLKQLRVPMFRWEHSQRGVCATTDDYMYSLIQLPCHDTLRGTEIDAMAAAIRSVLA